MVTAENMLLDRTSRFKDQFLKDLRQDEFSPGELLPARRILAERYKISSTTVARVVSNLIHEKTLSTRKGRFGGTYLLRKPEHPKKLKKLSFQFSSSPEKKMREESFEAGLKSSPQRTRIFR